MKKIFFITILVLGLTVTYSYAQMHQGMMGSGEYGEAQEYGYQPYYGGMGPGMMGSGGYHPCPMGQGGMMGGYGGMMGHGMGMMPPGMMGYGMGPGMMQGGGMMGGMMGPGMHGYGGYGMWGYNPESYQKYMNETANLRKELHNKKFDYYEALRDPKTDREKLSKLEKEIWELKQKINEKAPR